MSTLTRSQFVDWLIDLSVPLSLWGSDVEKHIDALYRMYGAGHSRFLTNTDGRLVVVTVSTGLIIRYFQWTLIEIERLHRNGHTVARSSAWTFLASVPHEQSSLVPMIHWIERAIIQKSSNFEIEVVKVGQRSMPARPHPRYLGIWFAGTTHEYEWDLPSEFFRTSGYVCTEEDIRITYEWVHRPKDPALLLAPDIQAITLPRRPNR